MDWRAAIAEPKRVGPGRQGLGEVLLQLLHALRLGVLGLLGGVLQATNGASNSGGSKQGQLSKQRLNVMLSVFRSCMFQIDRACSFQSATSHPSGVVLEKIRYIVINKLV